MLKFKSRKKLKNEIEHLTEEWSKEAEARKKEQATHRQSVISLRNEINTLKYKLSNFDDVEKLVTKLYEEIESLKKELAEQKDINKGLASNVTELKQRNKRQADRLMEYEKREKYEKRDNRR